MRAVFDFSIITFLWPMMFALPLSLYGFGRSVQDRSVNGSQLNPDSKLITCLERLERIAQARTLVQQKDQEEDRPQTAIVSDGMEKAQFGDTSFWGNVLFDDNLYLSDLLRLFFFWRPNTINRLINQGDWQELRSRLTLFGPALDPVTQRIGIKNRLRRDSIHWEKMIELFESAPFQNPTKSKLGFNDFEWRLEGLRNIARIFIDSNASLEPFMPTDPTQLSWHNDTQDIHSNVSDRFRSLHARANQAIDRLIANYQEYLNELNEPPEDFE